MSIVKIHKPFSPLTRRSVQTTSCVEKGEKNNKKTGDSALQGQAFLKKSVDIR